MSALQDSASRVLRHIFNEEHPELSKLSKEGKDYFSPLSLVFLLMSQEKGEGAH